MRFIVSFYSHSRLYNSYMAGMKHVKMIRSVFGDVPLQQIYEWVHIVADGNTYLNIEVPEHIASGLDLFQTANCVSVYVDGTLQEFLVEVPVKREDGSYAVVATPDKARILGRWIQDGCPLDWKPDNNSKS